MVANRYIFSLIFRSTRLYRYPFCQQNTACVHMKMNGSHLIFRCCKREARCLQRINAQWAWLVLESVEKWSMGLEIFFYILILKSYYFKWSPNNIKNVHMPEFIAAPLIWTLCKERQNFAIFIAWTTDISTELLLPEKCQSKSYPKHSQFVNIHISFI